MKDSTADKILRVATSPQCLIFIAWLVMTSTNLLTHHLIPPDETRYAAAAWEMWSRQDFLVPHLNGATYHHKPPLLFWLYALGWSLFGVNEVWPLLVSPICALACLYNLRYLARLLWPDNHAAVGMAPWLLFGSLLWGAFLNAAMFDTLLTACVLLAITGLIKASQDFQGQSWTMFTIGCGLGLLAKGPVVFVYTLIPFLTGYFWSETVKHHAGRWYRQGGTALLAGIVLALCWVIPAVLSAGDDYGGTLLWHQTVDRISHSFAHKRPFWWYLMLSPALFYPWFFWPRAWRNLCKKTWLNDLSFRFCLIWFATGFIGFSLISGKQVHYLIPLLPALALMLSRVLTEDQTGVKPGDALPLLVIILFGLVLAILPMIPGLKVYHWLQNRRLWWAALILAIGVGGAVSMLGMRRPSPYSVSVTVLLALTVSLAGFFSSTGNAFNLQQAAQVLEKYRQSGDSIAWVGKYEGQFQFLLRLTDPMEVIEKEDVNSWLSSHRNGHVIIIEKTGTLLPESLKADFSQYYRENKLWILSLR